MIYRFNKAQLIGAAKREIEMRREVYPRLIRTKKMNSGTAEYHLAAMKAVLKALENSEEISIEMAAESIA